MKDVGCWISYYFGSIEMQFFIIWYSSNYFCIIARSFDTTYSPNNNKNITS